MRLLGASVLLGVLTPVVPAIASPQAATRTTPAAAAPAALAWAPHIPGATRFDRTISAAVREVMVVSATSWRSRVGTITLYRRAGSGWHRVSTWPARLGYGGLVVGTRRVQDTGTTPAGNYSITEAFGRAANPGTAIPYTHVNDDQWWVEDRRSAYYNQMRLGSLGGFARTTSGLNSSEHLARMGAQYDYAAVIDFNRPRPVVGRGAGIFLHAFGSGSTGGCVSVSHAHMRAALQWLRPTAHPRIIIGQSGWLAA
jgi:L,D-peptidoglycan transpeptidase YkuD (ErfK/YbiS/YcfS/YnhG family)